MSNWTLSYDGFEPAMEGLRETLCTLGNGRFCTRGAAAWADADEETHYPGTYVHGGYNRLTTEIAGRPVENEDLVNLPNWLCLSLRIGDEGFFDVTKVEILVYRQELRLDEGTLTHEVRFRDGGGRESTLRTRRLVHMRHPHLAAIEMTLVPHGWSGPVTVRSALDGRVVNYGVKRYRELEHVHLEPAGTVGATSGGIGLTMRTNQSHIEIGEAARTRAYLDDRLWEGEARVRRDDDYVSQEMDLEARDEKPLRVEKVVALYTSNDRAVVNPGREALFAVKRAEDFEALLVSHRMAWQQLWRRCDVEFPRDERIQLILRIHLFHTLQTTSHNTIDLDTSAPARGLHGEAYRGHIFWDELYIFPLLNLRVPEITRGLQLYRYRRLEAARALARAEGYRGAMYPWQSGATGREETQTMHLNPKSGRWNPDMSHHQRHVNVAIAYDVWQYVRATGDIEFLRQHGAEMLLEIARFWSSIAHFNDERDRYEIHGVMGPDEFHEKYPDSEDHGLWNNAYTNVMVAWLMDVVRKALDEIGRDRARELREALGVSDEELALWDDMGRKMFVPFHGDGFISQFERYDALEELDWEGYRAKYGYIQRMDRILEAEGRSADRYKLSKQADLVMLFYLFPEEELRAVFERLGHAFDEGAVARNVKYYEARTSHGSTLSNLVHAWVTASYDPEGSWDRFLKALESDVADIQGGTTREGIHLGVMAGTVDLLQRGYLGLDVGDGIVRLDPKLPLERLDGLRFAARVRGTRLLVEVSDGGLSLGLGADATRDLEVRFRDRVETLKPGVPQRFAE